MYLSKNSRLFLRKGPWFPSYAFGRNIKDSCVNWIARWPEDDPLKPPLRINIPKDVAPSPYQCDAQMSSKRPERTGKADGFSLKWARSTCLSPDTRYQYSNGSSCNDSDEKGKPLRRSQSNGALEDKRDSSKRPDNQNCLVKSESSESFKSSKNAKEVRNNRRKREKNFKLKKIRSYEGVQLNSLPKQFEIENKNDVLTIQIALDDQIEDDKLMKKLSGINTTEDIMSDDQISELAEAIANELRSKNGTEPRIRASDQKKNDEAYLVIINVTDNENFEDPDVGSDRSSGKSKDKVPRTAEAREMVASQNLEGYGGNKQVRHLDIAHELDQNISKKKIARAELWKKPKKTKDLYDLPIRPDPVSRYIVNGSSEIGDMDLNQSSWDFFRPTKKLRVDKYNRYMNTVDLLAEKEKRREMFEKSLRRARTVGHYCHPNRKKYERIRRKEELNLLSEVSKRMGRSFPERLTEPTRPVVYAQEREVRTRTKIAPENYLEKKIEPFGENIKTEGLDTSSFIIKPLSKQIRMIDELPELLKYPEYKYSVLRKSADDDKLRSTTIRSYHNSCTDHCKLTENKSSLTIMDGLEKTCTKRDSDKTLTAVRASDGDASLTVDSDILRKEYSMSKLDNSLKMCSELSDNDIYLQEGTVIGNVTMLTATNSGESSKNGTQSSEDIKTGCSKSEDGCRDERYEPDITDVVLCQAMRFDGSYGMTLRVNKSAVEDDAKLKERNRILQFGNLSGDKFEMNAECVGRAESGAASPSGKKISIGESLLNSKKDAILNVVKNGANTPKISDNIANLANEEIAQNKGTANVDSLSMMKRVKEIVDLDLKNAEKIFNTSDPASMDHSPKTLENLLNLINLNELKSVIKHSEENNTFYVDLNELDHAKTKGQELADLRNRYLLRPSQTHIEKEDVKKEELKNDTPACEQRSAKFILKSGESIIVYDERTKEWKVDFTLLNDKPQKTVSEKNKESDGSSGKCQTSKDFKGDLPRERFGNSENIRDKGVEGSNVKDKNISGAKKKPKKDTAKELDAQEIRKKNSDLYEDLFDLKKQREVRKESEIQKSKKKAEFSEKNLPEHYVSKNIVKMSKTNGADTSKRLKSSKVETVKLNISSEKRPPSKVKEINLSQKLDGDRGAKEKDTQKQGGEFYKDLEKYKTPFTDPEYEEKQLKINSDAKNNPNLKKLDSWNKTLVLQEMSKSNENIESWMKDETDKMATLLLRVLQEAAEGNSRRRTAAKTSGKGNPYEAIRKKQENGLTTMKKKEPGKKKIISTGTGKSGNKILGELARNVVGSHMRKKGLVPAVGDEDFAEVPKEEFSVIDALRKMGGSSGGKENTAEDIPGPFFLKKLSSLWKLLPELGCQASIFLTIGLFSLAKLFLSFLKSDINKAWRDPFGGLFKKYGPVVKIHGPLSGDVVLINRPQDISTVFAQSLTPRSVFDSLEHCRSLVKQKNFPVGITESCNGIDWDIVRQSTTDISNKGCLNYFIMLKDTNAMLINRIEKIRNKQKQVPDDFICELKKWSMEGLCGILFDKSLGFLEQKNSQVYWVCESERLLRHFQEATNALCQCESKFQLWRFLNTPAISSLSQAYQSLDLIISKYVYQAEISLRKKRKAVNSHKLNTNNTLNFLESVLLNDRMTPEDITASVIDAILIGVNTTTIALGFLLYNVAQNSRVQRNLYQEIKDLLPNKSSEINYHQLQSLKYLQACLKESMRMNVPIPLVLRILPSDISIAQYFIPNGTHMVMDTQTACMKEQNFDEPEKFRPERWLDQSCIHPFSSIPFSNGPREGFIKHIAEVHLLTCIAKIVRNYHIEYHFGEIKSTGRVMSYPDKPLKLTFVERED